MSHEASGTHRRPRGEPRPESGGTQVFPLPPRAPERSVEAPVATDGAAVAVLTTVGVGAGPAAPPSPASLPRPARPAQTRAPQEPTRIFVLSSGSPAGDGQPLAGGEVSRRTATFASPPFAPVPNVVAPPRGAGVIARLRPPSAARALSKAKPSADASPAARAPAAPRLRAFDDVRARVTAWATAQTLTAPVAEVAQAVAKADQAAAKVQTALEAGEARPRCASLGLLARLRALPPARKLCLVVLAMTAVVSGGSLAGRSIAQTRVAKTAAAKPAAARPAVSSSAAAAPEPSAAVRPAAVVPVTDARVEAARVESAPAERETPAAAATPVASPKAASLADPPSAASSATLSRRAVDALLAGDRAAALPLYRQLARAEPERRVYREAVRLLAQPVAETP